MPLELFDIISDDRHADVFELVGIMGYEGHCLRIQDLDEKRRQIDEAMGVLAECRDAIREHGMRCDIVSAAGTGSYQFTSDHHATRDPIIACDHFAQVSSSIKA